jgi:hypothetical protein
VVVVVVVIQAAVAADILDVVAVVEVLLVEVDILDVVAVVTLQAPRQTTAVLLLAPWSTFFVDCRLYARPCG